MLGYAEALAKLLELVNFITKTYFSPEAKLAKLEKQLAVKEAKEKLENEHLLDKIKEIENTLSPSKQDLLRRAKKKLSQ